ncbi:MAG: thioesterase family protein [Bacillota bacterium]
MSGGDANREPSTEPIAFHFSIEEDVRFRDLDALGHVNNAVYLTYFEQARIAYFQHLGWTWPQRAEEWFFILAEARCTYRSAARLGERLRISVAVSDVGRSSFRMRYRIAEVSAGRLVAEGETVQVAYDYEQHRSVPLPDDVRRRLAEFEGRPEWLPTV